MQPEEGKSLGEAGEVVAGARFERTLLHIDVRGQKLSAKHLLHSKRPFNIINYTWAELELLNIFVIF